MGCCLYMMFAQTGINTEELKGKFGEEDQDEGERYARVNWQGLQSTR